MKHLTNGMTQHSLPMTRKNSIRMAKELRAKGVWASVFKVGDKWAVFVGTI